MTALFLPLSIPLLLQYRRCGLSPRILLVHFESEQDVIYKLHAVAMTQWNPLIDLQHGVVEGHVVDRGYALHSEFQIN